MTAHLDNTAKGMVFKSVSMNECSGAINAGLHVCAISVNSKKERVAALGDLR